MARFPDPAEMPVDLVKLDVQRFEGKAIARRTTLRRAQNTIVEVSFVATYQDAGDLDWICIEKSKLGLDFANAINVVPASADSVFVSKH